MSQAGVIIELQRRIADLQAEMSHLRSVDSQDNPLHKQSRRDLLMRIARLESELRNPSVANAFAYARGLGWLSPEEAIEQDKAMQEYVAMHEATRREREEVQGLKEALKNALHAIDQVKHLL